MFWVGEFFSVARNWIFEETIDFKSSNNLFNFMVKKWHDEDAKLQNYDLKYFKKSYINQVIVSYVVWHLFSKYSRLSLLSIKVNI